MGILQDLGKSLNGFGGLLAGGAGIAIGIDSLRSGDRAGAGIYLAQGIGNTVTALGPLLEAGTAQLGKLGGGLKPSTLPRLFAIGGSVSFILNVATAAAGLVYYVVDKTIGEAKRKDYAAGFRSTFRDYGMTEKQPSEEIFRPDTSAG